MVPTGDLFVVVERGAWAGTFLGMLMNKSLFDLKMPIKIPLDYDGRGGR